MVSCSPIKPRSDRTGCSNYQKEKTISATNFRINEAIRVPEVRLIGPNNENVGVVPIETALRMARDAEKDLVEVA